MLKLILALLISTCGSAKSTKTERCIATVFGTPGDKHMGTKTACKPYSFDPETPGIAHRTLPCGTLVKVTLTKSGHQRYARVVDRGPYGAIMDDGSWGKKIRRSDEGKWRGCVDMTPALSRAIGHNGYEEVEIAYVVGSN